MLLFICRGEILYLTDESYRSVDARTYLIDSCVFRPQQQLPAPPLPLPLERHPLVEASTLALRYATDTLKYITSYILYQTMVIEIWRIVQTNIKHRFREKYRPKVKYIDIHMHV
jgi:hypothetical protein